MPKSKPQKQATGPLGIFSWCLFDWANSAFATVIVTFIFSTYFLRSVAESTIKGTAYWGWMMGVSGVVVALLSPILGSVADYMGRRKPWIGIFSLGNILATAALYFVLPCPAYIWLALVLLFFANVFYELIQVFYNAMMTAIAPKDKIGRISGWGWGMGYAGGLVCLVIALYLFIENNLFSEVQHVNIRMVNLLVAVWFIIFAIPLFLHTPDVKRGKISGERAIRTGIKELWHTLKEIKHYKDIFLFLIARLFYIDALSTLFVFAGIYAAGSFHMTYKEILIYAIILNVAAGVGAGIFAWVDDWIGPKFTITCSLVCMIISGVIILIIKSVVWFWILSAFLGIFVGPAQAASRSYMARLSPPNLMNQMFGIYQLSGRVTTFIGPILVGSLTKAFNSQRIGMGSIFVMMFIGYLILLKVAKPKMNAES